MKLILFIGHHKVGSTALQDFLSRNAVALMRAGILYPAVETQGQALLLARALYGETPDIGGEGKDGKGGKGGALPINLREAHNALAFRMLADEAGKSGRVPEFHKGLPGAGQMFRALRHQVEYLKPKAVILCSEVFANFGQKFEDPETSPIGRIARTFPEAEVTIMATLRRIDDYLAAWHGQRLRFGEKFRRLPDGAALRYCQNTHFDYRRMIEPWAQTFPGATLRLRTYDEVLAAGGSIADMTEVLGRIPGVRLPEGLTQPDRTNASLHRGLVDIARRGNWALPGPAASDLQGYLDRRAPELGLPPSRDVELYGADLRDRLVDRFAPIDAWLGEQAGRPGFFPDLDEARTPRPVPEEAAAETGLAALRAGLRFHPPRGDHGPAIAEFLRGLDLSQPVPARVAEAQGAATAEGAERGPDTGTDTGANTGPSKGPSKGAAKGRARPGPAAQGATTDDPATGKRRARQ
ncbi:hypothetical protein [Chachezhania antarctica]|uniref:hypothetical protein n=1 Tax=Chachezhania antarctica TaxID=2340860 RepID=UPI000EB19CD8|nr:hypothetical protein [Chachezhania antarctica]